MREHLLRDMAGNVHDRLVARAALRQFGNERVPVVVPAAFHLGFFAHHRPGRLECRDVLRGISRLRLPERKDIPLRLNRPELLLVPLDVIGEHSEEVGVERNGAARPGFGLRTANGQIPLRKINLRPGKLLDLSVAHSRVEGQRQRQVDMRRAGLRGFLQHSLLLPFAVRLADRLARLQLEHLRFAKAEADEIARLSKDAKEKADLFIDALGRGLFTEAVVLILDDYGLIEIHCHLCAQEPLQMVESVIGEAGGTGQAEFVAIVEIIRHIPKRADSFAALIRDVIEALFKLALAALFGFSRKSLRCSFRRLANALTGKPELIPPNVATPKYRHNSLLLSRALQCHANRAYIEKHLLCPALWRSLDRNEAIFGVPFHPVPVRIGHEASTTNLVGYPECNLESLGNQRISKSSTRKPLVNRQPCQQKKRQVIGRQTADIFGRHLFTRHARCSKGEITQYGSRRGFIGCDVSYPDGTFC
jgi:hypothetical protein